MAAQKSSFLDGLLQGGASPDTLLMLFSGLGIVMIAWSISQVMVKRDKLTPRLKMIQQRRAELKGNMLGPKRRDKKQVNQDTLTLIRQIVAKLKLVQQHQVGQLQRKLTHAGYRSRDAIVIFAFAKLIMPFVGLGIGFLLGEIDWNDPFTTDQATGWGIVLGTAFFCARLPEIVVANARAKRYQALRKGLPDALDLMMICAEAGLSLAAALDRVAQELGRMSPQLAAEFSLTSVELGFLPERSTALRNLYERAGLPEIRGFVNVIMQTEKYGTPIAQALRTLSKEFRTQRMLRAEEKAARLPAMMTVPMIVFILPTLFIVVLSPAVISVMDSF